MRSKVIRCLYLSNPDGDERVDAPQRMLDELGELNQERYAEVGDPEIQSRIAQYEMAYRMQTSVPELTDISDEPQSMFWTCMATKSKTPGTFAANCLLARRMAERGVRFTQIFIRQWDQHGNLPNDIRRQCGIIDQPCAALIQRSEATRHAGRHAGDLGWRVRTDDLLSGRSDQRPTTAATIIRVATPNGWPAAVIKPGIVYGETDDFSYNVTENPVHIHDLNATILHCLGIDHERLTFRHQGRDFRLTDVHGNVVKDILA